MDDLLKDRCTILNRTVTKTGKRSTESWQEQSSPVKCRKIIRVTNALNMENLTHATKIMGRFVLKKNAVISAHDRIQSDGQTWNVIALIPVGDYDTHHKVAVCEVVS